MRDAAVQRAMAVYRQLLPFWERGDYTAKRPTRGVAALASPTLLVAMLRDGNEHVPDNNEVVDRLQALGAASIAPLRAAIEDREFPGRGYAAWALACVLRELGSRDEAAMATLQAARRDRDPYVAELAHSGLARLD